MLHDDLSQWLNHISQLHPRTIDLGLSRVKTVAERLGIHEVSCPVFTVAGTNGKGSCVAILEKILLTENYRVASFTSPHILRFNERFRINGKNVDDASLCHAFSLIEKSRHETSLSYFEFNFLAALIIFKQHLLDAIILEVGMGGRLDAVNIIDPDVAIITSIGIDHTDYLGPDRESIAREKAGIFRFKQLAVCGDPKPPQSLLKIAEELQVDLYCQGRDFNYEKNIDDWSFHSGFKSYLALPNPTLLLQNTATTLMALQLLKDRLPVSERAIHKGLTEVKLIGRFQIVERPIETILDVAHNPDSAQLLADKLKQLPCDGKTFCVWSMLENKDHLNSVKPLSLLVDKWFYASLEQERAASCSQLEVALRENKVKSLQKCADLTAAYSRALAEANDNDRIIVFGSFYTVAAIMSLLYNEVLS